MDADLHTEVAVVGGGITGLTRALLLAEPGKRVAVLETRRLSAGVSGRTTLISDALFGNENRYASAAAVLSENAETAPHLMAGHLKPVSERPVEELGRGQGCIVKCDGRKRAVYRDDAGAALHTVSAICTHQSCQIAFNPIGHSWGCPCHGSRFDVDGRVVDRPAEKRLPRFP